MKRIQLIVGSIIISLCSLGYAELNPYPWIESYETTNALQERIAPPVGYERVSVPEDSFAHWLRGLPLKGGRPPVYLFNGKPKRNQDVHVAVIDMDVGTRDLQQCADAAMRLRAEYLYSHGDHKAIHFNFTSGDRASYTQWSQGFRPVISGSDVQWTKQQEAQEDYSTFKRYMKTVFIYAGTLSLSQEMASVEAIDDLQPGDVFIQGGSPGHAVMVVDVAQHPITAKKVFLLAQSYMPAQEMHIVKNPKNPNSPWYSTTIGDVLATPEWQFNRGHLKRFK